LCKFFKKPLSEIRKLDDLERLWLLHHIYQDEKEKYHILDTLMKVIRPELLNTETTVTKADDSLLLEELKQYYPDKSDEELQQLLKENEEVDTLIDRVD
jgi:hypothetical protein